MVSMCHLLLLTRSRNYIYFDILSLATRIMNLDNLWSQWVQFKWLLRRRAHDHWSGIVVLNELSQMKEKVQNSCDWCCFTHENEFENRAMTGLRFASHIFHADPIILSGKSLLACFCWFIPVYWFLYFPWEAWRIWIE